MGYEKILLDTAPFLETATALYRSFGFREIPPYWDNPFAEALFFELSLAEPDARDETRHGR